MNVRYQRDLYRVQLCCDTEREETESGYPLQMCLRNTIEGLLVCQIQRTDGRLTVCWDVTSRHSLAQVTENGQIAPSLLQRVLLAIVKTLEEMERFLVPCEYLVLDPAFVFLTPETGSVGFLCDFEDRQSFQKTLLILGEYVLEHMDHHDEWAMHLGYGLYRLAVEESFDKRGLRSLCVSMPEDEEREKRNGDVFRKESVRPQGTLESSFQESQKSTETEKKNAGTAAEKEIDFPGPEDALEAFFAEDETEEEKPWTSWQICGGCALAILSGTGIMEGVLYFRNGRHLQLIWLVVAVVLCLVSSVAMLILWKLSAKKESAVEKKTTKQNWNERKKYEQSQHAKAGYRQKWHEKNSYAQNPYEQLDRYKESGYEQSRYKQKQSGPAEYDQNRYEFYNYDTGSFAEDTPGMKENLSARDRFSPSGYEEKTTQQPESWETTVLNRFQPQTAQARLCFADGTIFPLTGQSCFVGKSSSQANLCLAQPTVSRLHARIWEKDGAYYIEDMHSRNGTLVEGSLLKPGEKRQLASGMQLVFAEVCCEFLTDTDECEPQYSCNVQ